MRRMSFALALMAVLGFGGLLIENASAQNPTSSPTMNGQMGPGHGRRHSKHRKHRKHRRHRRHNMNKTGNANQ